MQIVRAALLVTLIATPALGWDSDNSNPTHATHTYLTDCALDRLDVASGLQAHRAAIVTGANTELHELPVSGTAYGLDLETIRIAHHGTNAGTDDIEGWWTDALAAYRAGEIERAMFLLGVMLHMIEDMGVPAHANGIYHQGTAFEFDNFEFMATLNWRPSFADINRADPAHAEPWRYYAFSRDWAHTDAPGYSDTDSFSKFWIFASGFERRLLANRQGRTCMTILWTLQSAARAFAAE